ncbi:radical SAM protein [Phocaeicola sp.]
MIESEYNYYIPYEGNIICMNGITGSVFSLKKNEFDFMKRLMNDEILQEKYPQLTHKFIRTRFLTTSMNDEKNHLKELHKRANNNGVWYLILNPTQDCNFRCWYCYEKHPKGWMQPEIMDRIKQLVNHIFAEGEIKHFRLSWFGGEPLLYFDEVIYPLSIYIKQCAEKYNINFSNSITTNGFLLTKEIINKCKEVDLNSFQITLDGDRDSHNKIRNQRGEPSFDRILQNCIDLTSNYTKSIIQLRINYNTKSIQHDFSTILDSIPQRLRSQFYIQFQRIWQTIENEGNDDDVKKVLDENFAKLKSSGFNLSVDTNYRVFKGILCYADRMNYANINYDGNVYRCTAQNYTQETALGYLDENGHIIWNKEKTEGISKQAFFDNPACLNCKYLALCGGPCFYAWWTCIRNRNNIECPNKKDKLDINLSLFIKEYYLGRLKRKALLR